jgi:hypothetical protein
MGVVEDAAKFVGLVCWFAFWSLTCAGIVRARPSAVTRQLVQSGDLMDCAEITFTRHAFEQMFARGVAPAEVQVVIKTGDLVQEYPEDKPYPSSLLLAFSEGQPVHVLVARDPLTRRCYIVTVYVPDPTRWESDFRRRRDGSE